MISLATQSREKPIIMDGGMGSELELRGVEVPRAPWWTAWNTKYTPEEVAAVHRDYARAGATLHTTNTFRSKKINIGPEWEQLTKDAYSICRGAVPEGHLVAGSVSPLTNCYDPEAVVDDAYLHHKEMASLLSALGVDVLLCETFCNVTEAYSAIKACKTTDKETWVSFTAGPNSDLMSPTGFRKACLESIGLGVDCVLLNCTDAEKVTPYLEAISDIDIPKGVFANAGDKEKGVGWEKSKDGAALYTKMALHWFDLGATIVGGCCGTRPVHIETLSKAINSKYLTIPE